MKVESIEEKLMRLEKAWAKMRHYRKQAKRSQTMTKKKKKKASNKREPNITFRVKDMIKAMELVLEDYGNICVCNLILNCVPGSINCCIYDKRYNLIYFKNFANEEEAFSSITEDEVIVHGIARKKKEEENEME